MPATRVLAVHPEHPDPDLIAEAASVIRRGGLVAFPTETVYGLGADALDAAAVRRIFEAKGRPSTDPLIVHLADATWLDRVVVDVPERARALAARFWPGPLTLVLPKHPAVPPEVTAGLGSVAVRVPQHPVAHALLEAVQRPIAAPSANLFSRPSPTTAAHVMHDLAGRIDVVLDGGATRVGVESTVLDLTTDPPVVLRPGGVPAEALRAIFPALVVRQGSSRPGEAQVSPGRLDVHYAPRAPLYLFEGEDHARVMAALRSAADLHGREGRRVAILVGDEDAALLADARVTIRTLGPRDDPAAAASRLFAALRDLEREGVDIILATAPPAEGLGLAVRDRLRRAATGRFVQVS